MGVVLRNGHFSARIAKMGAEIKSLQEEATGTEYIWCANPDVWNGSAPILFPIVGGLKQDTYRIDGQSYSLPAHGCVRKKEWSLVASSGDSATFETTSGPDTRDIYPYEFVLRATFDLRLTGLSVTYEVLNESDGEMLFSIGSHPAFNLPFAGGEIEDYHFHFSEAEDMKRYFFDDGMILTKSAPIFNNSRNINLSRTLFDEGPIIFKRPKSKAVTIMNGLNPKRIRLSTDGMPFLALWSKPDAAPFVCIEPWFGVPDVVTTNQDFRVKEGVMTLARGGRFVAKYNIDVLEGE